MQFFDVAIAKGPDGNRVGFFPNCPSAFHDIWDSIKKYNLCNVLAEHFTCPLGKPSPLLCPPTFTYRERMESPRLPRFKRAATVAPMQLTERDRQIIRQIYQHRFLRSPHIVALIGDGSQQLLRRLQLLFHHGYLERPRSQIDYFHQGGSRHIAYGLGNKGAALLKQEMGASFRELRSGEKNRSVGRVYLEHALLVSEVMLALELACRQTGHVRLLTGADLPVTGERERCTPFKWSVKTKEGVKLGVIPDRVFGLEFPDANGNPTRAFFFLEADRGTMPVTRRTLAQTSFFRKLLAYEATWSQGIHRTRFGFHRFRVLAVTTSVERVQSLVNACSQLERGQGLFLFADRTVLEKPEGLLSTIWQTGRSGETGSLLN